MTTPHDSTSARAGRSGRLHNRRAALAPTMAIALMAGGSLVLTVGGMSPATANPAPAPVDFIKSTTGAFTQPVPDGVCAVDVTLRGGAGGSAIKAPDLNGAGAVISATYRVVPGQSLQGFVGGGGGQGSDSAGSAGAAGVNGGGRGGLTSPNSLGFFHHGAGGGGYSELRVGSQDLIIAGGGGGAGGGHATDAGMGGDAGLPNAAGTPTAGQDGVDGQESESEPGTVNGGQGGQASGPGSGGVHSNDTSRNGFDAVGRTGGNGGNDATPDAGGGGGGGLLGGGGGASTVGYGGGAATVGGVGGAGGGGGASYLAPLDPTGGTGGPTGISATPGPKLSADGDGADGSVTLDWIPCTYDLAVTKTAADPTVLQGGTISWTVEVTNNGPDPMTSGDVVSLVDSRAGADTTITGIDVSGGVASGLGDAPMTCNAVSGAALPATLVCDRPYAPSSAIGSPTGGPRGLNVGETLTVTYEEDVAAPGDVTNTATVQDRNPDTDSATETVEVTEVTPTATDDTSSGPQGLPQTEDVLANDTAGNPAVPLVAATLTLLDDDNNPVSTLTVPQQGTYTIANNQIVFTPLPAFTGQADPVDYRVEDTNGTTARATYTPTVTAVTPVATDDTSSGPQGTPQTEDVLANDDPGNQAVPLVPATLTLLDDDNNPVSSVTVPQQGTYTIANNQIVFTPLPAFTGQADPVDYRVEDTNGTTTRATYTPTVTPVAVPDTSTGPQGLEQTKDVLANDTPAGGVTLDPATLVLIDSAGDPVTTVIVANQGVYTVEDGQVVFTPLPGFTGVATPVRYQVDDSDDNTVESTYTPTVTPVAPGLNDDVTSGPQGLPQSVDPLVNDTPGDPGVPLTPGSLTLLDDDGDPVATVTVPEGTYEIVDGRIVFTPVPSFTGEATPVTYRVADQNGTEATSTYTPTVTPVAPSAHDDATSGPQGLPQSVDPLVNDTAGDPGVPLDPSTLTLLDASGNPVGSLTVAGQGTFSVKDATIVFTPEPRFTGTATPADYRVADANGTTTRATYTPRFSPVTPVAEPNTSSGPIEEPQSVDPLANDRPGVPGVPLAPASLTLLDADGNPVDQVEGAGEGLYSMANGRLVFTPAKGFTGTAKPVMYRIADTNGTTTTSTYTPTVLKPGVKNVGTISNDNEGQVGDPVTVDTVTQIDGLVPGSVMLVDPDGEHVRRLVVPGEGVWTVNRVTGAVTFRPESGFEDDPTPVKLVGHLDDGTPITGRVAVRYSEPAAEPGGLPRTGSSTLLMPVGVGGAALLFAGVWLMRRRRVTTA